MFLIGFIVYAFVFSISMLILFKKLPTGYEDELGFHFSESEGKEPNNFTEKKAA
jgi:hypothetical protein